MLSSVQNPPSYQASGQPPRHPQTYPPVQDLQVIPGYENTGFLPTPTAPPPPDNSYGIELETDNREPYNHRFSVLTNEQVRNALVEFTRENCCYGNGPAKDMVFENITTMSTCHYSLETFTERRETCYEFKPYDGFPIRTGIAPAPWEIHVSPPSEFENGLKTIEVPNTAFLRLCHFCNGQGIDICANCLGTGAIRCHSCHGSGRRFGSQDDPCVFCGGTGRLSCSKCSSCGRVKCMNCHGKKQIKFYVLLKVEWKNHLADVVSESGDIPKELFRGVSGQIAFQEKRLRVRPILTFPVEFVNRSSLDFITKHQQEFAYQKILQQRHSVRIIPISLVHYKWKRSEGQFFVFGYEDKVFFPDYPQKCCCTLQ